jgi:hypothetical protein
MASGASVHSVFTVIPTPPLPRFRVCYLLSDSGLLNGDSLARGVAQKRSKPPGKSSILGLR